MSQERNSEKPQRVAQPEPRSQPGVPAPASSPGEYYFIPGTNKFRPEILEKIRQIQQGKY